MKVDCRYLQLIKVNTCVWCVCREKSLCLFSNVGGKAEKFIN